MTLRIIGIIISFILLAVPAVAGSNEAGNKGNIPELIEGLKGWDRNAIQANFDALFKIGRPAVPYLIKALKSDDPGVRSGAARLLGDLQAEEAVIPLGELLNDPKYWVTRSVVFSLGNIGTPAVIPILKKALKHYKDKVQEAALWSLDELQDKSSIPEIADMMLSSRDQYIRWQALRVLRSLQEGAEIKFLIDTLRDPKAKVTARRTAATLLGELKVESAVPVLIEAIEAKDPDLRWRAIEAVGKIGASQARAAIEKRLEDPDRDVKMFAIGTLGRMGSKESVAALSRMLVAKSSDLKKNTIRSLGKIGGEKAARAVKGMLADRNPYVRAIAIETLVNLDDRSVVEEIKLLASDRSPIVRTAVMYALGELRAASAKDTLQAATTDKNIWVKEEAERALKKLGP